MDARQRSHAGVIDLLAHCRKRDYGKLRLHLRVSDFEDDMVRPESLPSPDPHFIVFSEMTFFIECSPYLVSLEEEKKCST